MNSYDFTGEQVRLLKSAINAYTEMYSTGYRYNGRDTEEKLNKMGDLYQILSNQTCILNTEDDCFIYPICDY